MRLFRFTIESRQFGISADSVSEIVRAVAVTPLPGAPAVVEGIIDVRGTIVPVYDLRRRFALGHRPVELADHFVLARAGTRAAALHVDQVLDLVDVSDTLVDAPDRRVHGAQGIAGVATLDDGLVLIHDVDSFLSAAEADSLDAALETHTADSPQAAGAR